MIFLCIYAPHLLYPFLRQWSCFHGWVIFLRVCAPHLYPFLRQRPFLLPWLSDIPSHLCTASLSVPPPVAVSASVAVVNASAVSTGVHVSFQIVVFSGYMLRSRIAGNGTPLQYSCLESPTDGGARWAAVHGVAKSQTRLSDFTFTFHFYALEKDMATHSSVLAWRIPGTGEPGGLPSMGSHRVGHDWSDLAAAAAAGLLDHMVVLF